MTAIRAFTMPKWGIEMTEGTLAEWSVREGEAFSKGATLCLIETDKITNEVEAEFDGVLRRALVSEGDTLAVGALLGVFASDDVADTDIEDFIANFKAADTSVAAKSGKGKKQPPSEGGGVRSAAPDATRPISPQALKLAQEHAIDLGSIEGSGPKGRITHQDVYQATRPPAAPNLRGPAELTEARKLDRFFASPLAKRLAAIHNVDLAGLKGTGPRGRIRKADILALVKKPTAGADTHTPFAPVDNPPSIEPMNKIRKVIARRLTQAKSTIPHFYLRTTVCADKLLDLRQAGNLLLPVKASVNDYLIKAVARALVEHPSVNIQVHGDDIYSFSHADISVAVATDRGLVTPVLRSADLMRIDQIADASKALIEKSKAGKLSYEDLEGGAITISNLGMFGIDQFDAIINPPQGSILAVGAIKRAWAEGNDGAGYFQNQIALALSCDHRAIDGAVGAAFLQSVKGYIENPDRLFEMAG